MDLTGKKNKATRWVALFVLRKIQRLANFPTTCYAKAKQSNAEQRQYRGLRDVALATDIGVGDLVVGQGDAIIGYQGWWFSEEITCR
jgi:hypothetical protein